MNQIFSFGSLLVIGQVDGAPGAEEGQCTPRFYNRASLNPLMVAKLSGPWELGVSGLCSDGRGRSKKQLSAHAAVFDCRAPWGSRRFRTCVRSFRPATRYSRQEILRNPGFCVPFRDRPWRPIPLGASLPDMGLPLQVSVAISRGESSCASLGS